MSVSDGRKRKKKKKRAKDANAGPTSVANAPQTLNIPESSPETEVPQNKKRRVSFAEPSLHNEGKNKAELSATYSEEASGEVRRPALTNSVVDSEGGKDDTSNLSKKKKEKKKKKEEHDDQTHATADEGQNVPEASEKKKKKKKKSSETLDSSNALEINQVQTTVDEDLQSNKSKKRARHDLPSEENEGVPLNGRKTIAEGNSGDKSNDERPTKKPKNKSTEASDSADAVYRGNQPYLLNCTTRNLTILFRCHTIKSARGVFK